MTARGSSRGRRQLAALTSVPIYPAALVAAFVISQFTVWWPPVYTLIRPLTVLILATVAVQLVASRVLGPVRGALVAALLLMGALEVRVAVLIAVVAALIWLGQRLRIPSLVKLDRGRMTRLLNVVGIGTLGMAMLAAITSMLGLPPIETGEGEPAVSAPADAPDIYLILLDGYPRADVLEEALDFDNTPFLNAMAGLGFDLAERSHSNYNRTALTVPSFLNGAQINDLLPDPPEGTVAQNRWLASLINRATAVAEARRLGYEFVHIPIDVQYLTPYANADLRDTGQLSAFEMYLADYGFVRTLNRDLVEEWHRSEHRARILDALSELISISAATSDTPRLVFAHIAQPHPPILFHRDGSEAEDPVCFWFDCDIREPMPETTRAAFREQTDYINDRVLDVARALQASSTRPPVIVFWSDHGFRHFLGNDPETFKSMLLAFTPDHENVFPEDAAPVNIIPRLLNTYLGADLPLAREDVWYVVGNQNGYFPLRESSTEPE